MPAQLAISTCRRCAGTLWCDGGEESSLNVYLDRAASPNSAPRMQRARGEGRVSTQMLGGATRLQNLYQEGAAKIRLPNTHDGSLQAVLMNTAGGLTDGDAFRWQAQAAAGSHLVLTTPACERVYRSLGDDATVDVHLAAEAGARIDWLPQETILFQDGRLRRRIDIDLAPDATLLGVEALLLGREAMGEDASRTQLSDQWRVRRDGRLVHAEATRLDGLALSRQSRSLLAGALAFATIVYVGADAERLLDPVRLLAQSPHLGVSLIGQKLVVRALAPSGLALRRLIIPIIAELSGGSSLPRLWTT